jgi:hypothetical protein
MRQYAADRLIVYVSRVTLLLAIASALTRS